MGVPAGLQHTQLTHTLRRVLLLLLVSPPGAQVQLSPDQCGSPQWTPCYNVYAVNDTHGDLVWFAFTTSSAAVKGMYLVSVSVLQVAPASTAGCQQQSLV